MTLQREKIAGGSVTALLQFMWQVSQFLPEKNLKKRKQQVQTYGCRKQHCVSNELQLLSISRVQSARRRKLRLEMWARVKIFLLCILYLEVYVCFR